MTITCTNFDIKKNHQDVLDILGADYDYSERSTWNNTAKYFTSDIDQATQDALTAAATGNFDIVIE
jgi:hypothetical protein